MIFLLLAALAAARPAAAEATRDFDQRLGMSRGDRVRVNDVNGDIVATRSASNQVRVRARISSPNDDLAGVSIKVSQRGSTVYVCPVFSGQTVGDDCRSEGDNNNWRKIRVDFTIEVPAGVNLDADTVNGKIVADVDGNVVAKRSFLAAPRNALAMSLTCRSDHCAETGVRLPTTEVALSLM